LADTIVKITGRVVGDESAAAATALVQHLDHAATPGLVGREHGSGVTVS
jgi:hypothetical protein